MLGHDQMGFSRVLFIPMEKQDHIRVLLDGARFSQVGQSRLRTFGFPVQLAQRQHGNAQLLRKGFQSARDRRYLFVPWPRVIVWTNQPDVIHNQQRQAVGSRFRFRDGPDSR